jgi:hypothetical protein
MHLRAIPSGIDGLCHGQLFEIRERLNMVRLSTAKDAGSDQRDAG